MISNAVTFITRCCASLMAFTASLALAQAPLDPTFAHGGAYSFPLGTDNSEVRAIVRDQSGHLITAGDIWATNKSKSVVTRHKAPNAGQEGVLDETFGTAGFATDFFGAEFLSGAKAIAIDHQNGIIVGNSVQGFVTCDDGSRKNIGLTVLTRLKNDGGSSDGHADLSFGTFGDAIYGDCHHDNIFDISSLVIAKDGSIVTLGDTWQDSEIVATLIRWTPAGQIDTTFGTGGLVVIPHSGQSIFGTALAMDGAGKIVISLESSGKGSLARYTANGAIDASFGTDGLVELPNLSPGNDTYPCCLAIDSQGRIIVAGTVDTGLLVVELSNSYHSDGFVQRFTASGKADDKFGLHGTVYPILASKMTAVNALAIDGRDRPILAGNTATGDTSPENILLFHLNMDGSLNSAVGSGGVYSTNWGFSGNSLLIDPLGRPTITSSTVDSHSNEIPVLIRMDELFGDGFD